MTAPLLTTAEVAAILGVTPRTVERWRNLTGGGPPYVRIGRRTIRYEAAAVAAFVQLYTVRRRADGPAVDPRQLPLFAPPPEERPS